MPRHKKSRKIGKIGISKDERPTPRITSSKPKNKCGKKPGSRQQLNAAESNGHKNTQKTDSRIGSKTSIDLNKYKDGGVKKTKSKAPEKRYFSPKEELDAIENDTKLDTLLDKQEQKSLSREEQEYVEAKLKRHSELCKMLGIDLPEEDEDTTNNDPFSSLDAINIDDFKD